MLEQMKKTIQAYGLLKTGDSVVAAVSGGPDSVALVHALASLREEYEWRLAAAHLDHQFRGEESKEDSRYVQRLCAEMNIPCFVESIDVPRFITETGLNLQEAARQVRYRFLMQVAKEMGDAKIATAHHADDQLETMLMRLVRGTSVEGLSGIPLRRHENNIDIVRPLLEVSRDQIERYCKEHGMIPRQDQSNFSDKYLRNRIRLHWIPLMRQENPQISDTTAQLASLLREENDYLRQESEANLSSIVEDWSANTIIIRQNDFLTHHLALQRRMIKLILSYLLKSDIKETGYVHIENIREIIEGANPAACIHLPGQLQVRREYQRVIFSSISDTTSIPPYIYSLNIPGQTYIPEIDRTIHCYYGSRDEKQHLPQGVFAVFDPAIVKGKLYVRQRRAGDRIQPLGMLGTKKVKDVLIDKKIPRDKRDRIPLLTDDEHILWIPGVKRSSWYVPHTEADVVLYVVLDSSLF